MTVHRQEEKKLKSLPCKCLQSSRHEFSSQGTLKLGTARLLTDPATGMLMFELRDFQLLLDEPSIDAFINLLMLKLATHMLLVLPFCTTHPNGKIGDGLRSLVWIFPPSQATIKR